MKQSVFGNGKTLKCEINMKIRNFICYFRPENELKRRLQNRVVFRLLGIEIITMEEIAKIHHRIIPRPQRYQTMELLLKKDLNFLLILLVFMFQSGCVVLQWPYIFVISDTWRPESTHNLMRKRSDLTI